MVYLLIGHPSDPTCADLRDLLGSCGRSARIVENPLAHPTRFAWRLDNHRSSSHLAWDDQAPLNVAEIAGVFVGSEVWLDPVGWESKDWSYALSEMQAALLGWMWSLDCPVVNRYPPEVWYRPRAPLCYWQPRLWRCGLRAPDLLMTNVAGEARAFGDGRAAVYAPCTGPERYLLAEAKDWDGLETVQRRTPVNIESPHGAARLSCVVGGSVVWEGPPPPEADALEPGLLRLARETGLDYLEVALATGAESGELVVIAVDPWPHYGWYGPDAQRAIAEGVVRLLTASSDDEAAA